MDSLICLRNLQWYFNFVGLACSGVEELCIRLFTLSGNFHLLSDNFYFVFSGSMDLGGGGQLCEELNERREMWFLTCIFGGFSTWSFLIMKGMGRQWEVWARWSSMV